MHGSAPEPGSLGTRAAPPGAGQAGALEGGESGLDWTKHLDYAAKLSRHLRHRPVAAALSHDPDGGGPPGPDGLGSSKLGSLPCLPASGPPAARPTLSLSPPARSCPLSRPSTARQPQGPIRVRFCQPSGDASVDPVNGPPAAGSRLCPSPPARRCCFSRSRQRPASRRVPTVSGLAGPEVLLQSIPSTARQPQGPDCVRACRLGGAASVGPVTGGQATGS